MVEKRHGGDSEWTWEGERKGLAAEYARRSWRFVNNSRLMYVSDERALFASSWVAPQEFCALVPANVCRGRSIFYYLSQGGTGKNYYPWQI